MQINSPLLKFKIVLSWIKKMLNGLNPELAVGGGNAFTKYAIENTRFEIPIFRAEENSHGYIAIEATVFPTSISPAATWLNSS